LSSYSLYAQDDWKPNDKVTVNAGLRYDFMTPQLERDNHIANFDATGAGRLLTAASGSIEDRALVNPDRNNIAPRIGLTYAPTTQSVFRGGYGIFYNLYDRIGSEDQLSLNVPFLINNLLGPATAASGPLFLLNNGLELAVERRFAHPFGFRIAYTLSKATDNAGEHLFTGGSPSFLQDARNRDSWEGPADQDTRHRVAANWILDLPYSFNFSGIVTARTGRPFTVTQSSNSVGNLMTGLPNRVGDGQGAQTVDSWFDKKAFQAVASGVFGNSGRNI